MLQLTIHILYHFKKDLQFLHYFDITEITGRFSNICPTPFGFGTSLKRNY